MTDADEKTNDLCITVAFWPEICIIRKQLYFYQKDPKR